MRKLLVSFLLVLISVSLFGCKKDEVIHYETSSNTFYYEYTMHEGESKYFWVDIITYVMTPEDEFITGLVPYDDQLEFDKAIGENLDLIDLDIRTDLAKSKVTLLKKTDKVITIDQLVFKIKETNDLYIIKGRMVIKCDQTYTGIKPQFPKSYIEGLENDVNNRGPLFTQRPRDAYAFLITAEALGMKEGFNFNKNYALEIKNVQMADNEFYTMENLTYTQLIELTNHRPSNYIDTFVSFPDSGILINYDSSRYGVMIAFDVDPKRTYEQLVVGIDLVFTVTYNGDEFVIYKEIIIR